jgi:hypothetical protein
MRDSGDKTRSLSSTWEFLFALYGPVAASVLACAVLWADGYWWNWSLSADGFNHFLNAFKLPLALLALVFPTVGLVAATHRSKEFVNAIEHQSDVREQDLRYRRLEAFEKFAARLIDKLEADTGFRCSAIPRVVYRSFYSDSANGDYSPNTNFIGRINVATQVLNDLSSVLERAAQSTPMREPSKQDLAVLENAVLLVDGISSMCRYVSILDTGPTADSMYREGYINTKALYLLCRFDADDGLVMTARDPVGRCLDAFARVNEYEDYLPKLFSDLDAKWREEQQLRQATV